LRTVGTCIIAADQSGNGTWAAATTVTQSFTVTLAAPTAVTVLGGDLRLTVSWTVDHPNGIVGYTATATGGANCSTVGADKTSCTIPDLTPGTTYTVSVIARGDSSAVSPPTVSGPASPLGGQVSGPTVRNANGSLQMFARRSSDGAVLTRIQLSGGTWPDAWTSLGGAITTTPLVVSAADGSLQVLAFGTDGLVNYIEQTAPASSVWTSWQRVAASGVQATDIGLNADGRVQIVGKTTASAVFTAYQTTVGGATFSTWASLGGVLVSDPKLIRGSDGLLEVIGRRSDNFYWHRVQTAANSTTWLAWERVTPSA
jgi:hypothetical protein